MKTQILVLFSVMIFYSGAKAQNKACSKVFEKYAGKEGFLTVNVPSSILDIFLKDKSKSDFKMKFLKVLSVEDKTLNSNLNFYDEIVPDIDRNEYQELMSVKGKDQDFIMFCKRNGDKITEFIFISGGKNNVLINFVGRIQLSDMYNITQSVSNNNDLNEIEPENPDK